MRDETFCAGELDTGFLDRLPRSEKRDQPREKLAAILAGAAFNRTRAAARSISTPASHWKSLGRQSLLR